MAHVPLALTVLTRSDSRSTADSSGSCGSGGVDDLTALFAAGHVDSIVGGLLAMRDALTRDSPDTVHTCFSDLLPEMMQANAAPFALVLQMLEADGLLHRPAGKVDLRTLLVRALRSCCIGEQLHSDAGEEAAGSLPAELTPALTAHARELCLRQGERGPFLSPRTFEAVVSLYKVQLSHRELMRYARCCFDIGAYRDAAEFLRMFRLEAEEPPPEAIAAGTAVAEDGFPHAKLLTHLAADRPSMDAFLNYLQQCPAFLARHAHTALTHLAEHSGGNDPNQAAKLVLKFGYRLSEFPRIRHLKVKDIVWWCVRIGKGGDFGALLCGEDRGLQRKLLRELSRSRNGADQLLACSFLEQHTWRCHLQDPDFAAFYARQKRIRMAQPRATLPSPDQHIVDSLNAAVRLHEEMQAAGGGGDAAPPASLLLPPLPVVSFASSSAPSDLPLLFIHPRSIVMVDCMDSLVDARAHLLAPDATVLGLDLEHLPENFVGLEVKPVLCQLLQIACRTKVFLFDLAKLHVHAAAESSAIPAEAAAGVPAATAAATASAGASTVASSAASSAPCFFPPVPDYSSGPASSPDPAFITGVNDLLLSLVLNEDVLKVGIGFREDLRKMRADFPKLIALQITMQNYADLTPLLKCVPDPDGDAREGDKRRKVAEAKRRAAEMRKQIKEAAASTSPAGGLSSLFGDGDDDMLASSLPSAPSAAPASGSVAASGAVAPLTYEPRGGGHTHVGKKEGGLAKLVRMVLRRTLDKSQQISNWARRPLSEAQRQYAALDAYVCVLINDKCTQQGIEVDAENIEAGVQ